MLFLAMAVYSVRTVLSDAGATAVELLVLQLITIEWFFWGYSLAFSETGSKFIGDLRHFGLINVLDAPSQGSSKIPALLFAFYQSMFVALTPVIVSRFCS
jgi:Amt family ammonium transporter